MNIEKLGITPGPWIKCHDVNKKIYEQIYSYGSGKIPISVVDRLSSFSGNTKDRNATLIAAAPEMLEALIRITTGDKRNHQLEIRYAKLIIEKATGKTWEEIKELLNE